MEHAEAAPSRRLDSPATPAIVALLVASGFVVARWLDAAGHRIGEFVVAGRVYADQAQTPPNLPVRSIWGYDGQFYYRLALDPFDLARRSFGIRFDTVSRVERIGYPFVAWALALGRHSLVPLTLVVTNVLACAVLGLAGGFLARSAGRHAAWGLVFPAYWGYLWTLGRDTSELVTAAFLLVGLALLVRHRPVWCGVALLGAVLSKETATLLVLVLALSALWERRARQPWRPRRADVAYVIPLAGFVVWELLLRVIVGRLPVLASGSANLGAPMLGLSQGVAHYLGGLPSVSSTLWLVELFVFLALAVGAGTSLGHAPVAFRFLWIAGVVLAVSAAHGVWIGNVGFRSLDEAYLTSWLVLLYGPRRLWPWAVMVGGTWLVVALELVRYV